MLAKWPAYLAAITHNESARIEEGEAIRVVARRSSELADATGLNATEIAAEIVTRRITPDDWAREHGLDPTTLRPQQ